MTRSGKLTMLCLFLLALTCGTVQSQVEPNYELTERFSPDNLRRMVFSTSVSPHWLKNTNQFWYRYKTTDGEFYYLVDPARKTKNLLFDPVKMAADMSRLTLDPFDAQHLGISKMKFIRDGRAIEFEVTSKLVEEVEEDGEDQEDGEQKKKGKPKPKVWYFLYDLDTQTLTLREDYEKPEDRPNWANIAPDSSYVLFARHHNLYWMDMENYAKTVEDEKDTTIVEHQWTTDGEEFYEYGSRWSGRGQTLQELEKNKDKRKRVSVLWSPNGQRFAMIKTDARKVRELFVIHDLKNPRPELETYKYQMPGEQNMPQDELHIFDFSDKSQTQINTEAFKDQELSILREPWLKQNRDDDFRPAFWLSGSNDQFFFQRRSRDLKRIDICRMDISRDTFDVLIEERLNTYVETRSLGLVEGTNELIHWSERDGWAHFYLYDAEGNLKNQITSGPFHCNGIEGIDASNRVLYFSANGREEGEDPYYRHLYKINFDGTGLKLLNPGNYDHSSNVNDEATYFVDNYSRVNTAPKSVLYNRSGQVVMELETADLSVLMDAGYQFPEPYQVKAGDGITDLYGVMYKPFDFDSTKQYPIIAYVYPGPQTEAVNKSFSTRMNRTDQLAQMGFIVITIGNRGGHPSRSKWYHNYGYGNLRDYGLTDKKVAIEQLAARHEFIDLEKVGIFGHSGGGFMSTAAMLVYPDFFKVAVSSAGNHENNIYNRWWSEKHHGVKEEVDDDGKVTFKYDIDTNSELAKNLKGHLLIVHGTVDNNVHPGNTIRLANALIKANKRFDFFMFPGQRHGFGNMSDYFFWMRADYFAKHLLGSADTSVDIAPLNRRQMKKR